MFAPLFWRIAMKLSGVLAEKGLQIFNGEMRYHAGHMVTRLWIVVANQEKAQVYRKIISDGLELIATAKASSDETHHHMPHEERVHQTPKKRQLHIRDPRDIHNRKNELRFVQRLATWLNEAQIEDAFDRLVLVAAPKTLGEIRPFLSEGVQARLMAQLDKDLASQPDHKIQEQLTKAIWF